MSQIRYEHIVHPERLNASDGGRPFLLRFAQPFVRLTKKPILKQVGLRRSKASVVKRLEHDISVHVVWNAEEDHLCSVFNKPYPSVEHIDLVFVRERANDVLDVLLRKFGGLGNSLV